MNPFKIKQALKAINTAFSAMTTNSGHPVFKTVITDFRPVLLEQVALPALLVFNRGGKQAGNRGDDQLNLTLHFEFHILMANQTEETYYRLLQTTYAVAHRINLNTFGQEMLPFKDLFVNTDFVDEFYGQFSRVTDKQKLLAASVTATCDVCIGESASSKLEEFADLLNVSTQGGVTNEL